MGYSYSTSYILYVCKTMYNAYRFPFIAVSYIYEYAIVIIHSTSRNLKFFILTFDKTTFQRKKHNNAFHMLQNDTHLPLKRM